MAYLSIPLIQGDPASYQLTTTADTATTGVKDTILVGTYSDVLGITAVCSSAAVVDIEASTDSQATILAGGGTWVPIVGLTSIGIAAKQVGLTFPVSAIRFNVKTLLAGTCTLSVLTACYSR